MIMHHCITTDRLQAVDVQISRPNMSFAPLLGAILS